MKSYTIDEILSRTSNLVLLENQKAYREHLAQFIRMHLLRVEAIGNGKPVASLPIISSLVIASSGTGKSFLMSEIAKAAGINVITVDCSNLSRAGWKGVNLGTLLYSELKRLKDKKVPGSSAPGTVYRRFRSAAHSFQWAGAVEER